MELADSFEKYPHSSAGFYELNEQHLMISITHYSQLGDAIYLDQ